ncbi:MAG: hypothetical protein ACYS6Z_04850, partial [Planctomycetota bacterium]
MKRLVWLLFLTSMTVAQGGRDSGTTGRAILFVRWERTDESHAIWVAAWRALEPHFVGQVNRRRLASFDGDEKKARAFFAQHKDVVLVVAFGAEAARVTRKILPETPVLEVSPGRSAHVSTRVDRERFARLLLAFHPRARRIAVLGPAERLADYEISPRGELAWVPEEGAAKTVAVPLVTTSSAVPKGVAALTVRPDPQSAGLKVAALVVRKLRDGKPFREERASRLRITVDLGAARRVGYEVP